MIPNLIPFIKTIIAYSLIIIAVEYILLGLALVFIGKIGLGGSYICYAGANVFIYYAAFGVQ